MVTENIQEELVLEEFKMKGEKESIKENSSSVTPVEANLYVQEDDVKMEGLIRNNKIYFLTVHFRFG